MRLFLPILLLSFTIIGKAQTLSTRDVLNNLHPFWEFLENQREDIEAVKGIELTASLELSNTYIKLELNDATDQLFYRVQYQIESPMELTRSSFYCADSQLSTKLEAPTNNIIEFFSWDSISENTFPLSSQQIDYLEIAERITANDDHHGVRETLTLTTETIHISRSNHWNAKSLDHKDSYYLTDLDFIIPLKEALHKEGAPLTMGSQHIGDMEIIFYDGSAESQQTYGDNITESIADEKEKYNKRLHIFSPSVRTLLEASKPLHQKTFKLKFLLRVLPDNGWFLQFYKDGHYEYVHWSGWSDHDGIIEQGFYTIENNQVILQSDTEESEFTYYTFYLITSDSKEIDNNISIDCQEHKGTNYCLYKVYEKP